jgi:hypothetical protein
MVERRLYLFFQLDTNRINARQGIPAMNYLENWHRRGLIEIIISDVVQVEASAGGHSGRTRKALSYVFAIGTVETAVELDFKRKVEQLLFPSGLRDQADANDVEIVARAKKYHSILVTADGNSRTQPGGILGHRRELAGMGVKVMTAEEAVELVRQKINIRDERARHEASRLGSNLPSWVGRD